MASFGSHAVYETIFQQLLPNKSFYALVSSPASERGFFSSVMRVTLEKVDCYSARV
jgi:hypothetical protein